MKVCPFTFSFGPHLYAIPDSDNFVVRLWLFDSEGLSTAPQN